MTTMTADRIGKWMALARDRRLVMLADGRQAVLIGVQKHAMTCRILHANRHWKVWSDDITAYWSDDDSCWKQLASWEQPSLPGRALQPPSYEARLASKSWLTIRSALSPAASAPMPVPPPPPRAQ